MFLDHRVDLAGLRWNVNVSVAKSCQRKLVAPLVIDDRCDFVGDFGARRRLAVAPGLGVEPAHQRRNRTAADADSALR